MKIHEYQAREIFARYEIPVLQGEVCTTPEHAKEIAQKLKKSVVIKAQVQVGGRGKAGGIKLAKNPEEAEKLAKDILGMQIKGIPVEKIMVAEAIDIKEELYIGMVIDRAGKKIVLMTSEAGGVEIEEVARETPDKIHKVEVDPLIGLKGFQIQKLIAPLFEGLANLKVCPTSGLANLKVCPTSKEKGQELPPDLTKTHPSLKVKAEAFTYPDSKELGQETGSIIRKLYQAFVENSCSLAEINPLVITNEGKLLACDTKINIDDNALFREELANLRDPNAEDPLELEARQSDLSYVGLDGNVACIVNGAGLAMTTMDLIKLEGGEPANFLDVGGSSSPTKVVNAMRIILTNKNVRSILINIFGGITRCDDIAAGIIEAMNKMEVPYPIVVRLTGTNQEKAREMLANTDLHFASSFTEGVKKAIELAKK